jgi:hypothetical protein
MAPTFGGKLRRDFPDEGARDFPMFVSYAARGTIAAPTVQLNHTIQAVLARSLLRSCFAARQPEGASPARP